MPYIFKTVIASGTLAAGNAKLSMVDATAFADSVGINLAQYVDGRAMLYLRNTTGGYEAFAFLGAVGAGETLDVDYLSGWNLGSGWTPVNVTVVDVDTYNVTVAGGTLTKVSSVTSGALYKFSYTGADGVVFLDTVALLNSIFSGSSGVYRTANGTGTMLKRISGIGTVNITTLEGNRVLTPSTSGVTLKNLAGAQSFIFKHASFNPNAEMTWRVVTDKKIYRIL